jgi:hypothetical protein
MRVDRDNTAAGHEVRSLEDPHVVDDPSSSIPTVRISTLRKGLVVPMSRTWLWFARVDLRYLTCWTLKAGLNDVQIDPQAF